MALVLVAALAACGKAPTEEGRVRDLMAKLAKATSQRDYKTLCDDVLAASLVKDVEQSGVPCADALRAGLGSVRRPRLRVGKVTVKGKRATAKVHTSAAGQRPSDDTVALVKTDAGWRVESLANR